MKLLSYLFTSNFSLKQTDDFDSFTIDEITGNLTINNKPDAELKDNYKFTILAEGTNGEYIQKDYSVNVNNIGPVFTSTDTISADENIDLNSVIHTVTTNDASSINLKNEGDFEKFELDSATGEIRVKGRLDYEEKNLYEFTIVAQDNEGEIEEQKITLSVNNNTPNITSSDKAYVKQQINPGSYVFKVTADENVTFQIKDVDHGSNFTIDRDSGILYINNPPELSNAYKSWSQVGDAIYGLTDDSHFGSNVTISADGNTFSSISKHSRSLASSSPNYWNGYLQTHELTQNKNDLNLLSDSSRDQYSFFGPNDLTSEDEGFISFSSLSADGKILTMALPTFDVNTFKKKFSSSGSWITDPFSEQELVQGGAVFTFERIGDQWNLLGMPIFADNNSYDHLGGVGLKLSNDGKKVAIASKINNAINNATS